MMAKLPISARRVFSSGDADILLTRRRKEPRTVPLSMLTDVAGQRWALALYNDDLLRVYETLTTLLDADQDTMSKWWRQLAQRRAGGRTTPGAAADVSPEGGAG